MIPRFALLRLFLAIALLSGSARAQRDLGAVTVTTINGITPEQRRGPYGRRLRSPAHHLDRA